MAGSSAVAVRWITSGASGGATSSGPQGDALEQSTGGMMNKLMQKVSLLGVMALSLFVWGCDNVGRPTEPGLTPGNQVFSSTAGQRYAVAQEHHLDVGIVTATIGPAGGKLSLGHHELTVPRGAVAGPTVFALSRVDGSNVRVRLTATAESENDVGAAGFAVPVKLSLSFHKVADLPSDLSTLTILYFRSDGLVDDLGADVQITGKRASSNLRHFSDYGLAWPL
jgi:hypothetical protein